MQLTYVGAHDGVEIDLPDGQVAEVERGGKHDFPAELAESLLAQETNWEPADAAAKKLAAKVRVPADAADAEEPAPDDDETKEV